MMRIIILFIFSLMLAACGFQLRGHADLAFKTIYIQGSLPANNKRITQLLKANDVQIVQKAEDADVVLEYMGDTQQKVILSLSGAGLVREFDLYYRESFRTKMKGDELWSTVQTVDQRRDFSYSDSELLAKSIEEAQLFEDMRNEAANEVLRRLLVLKPH